MKKRHSHVVIPAGPVMERGEAPGRRRRLALGEREWELAPFAGAHAGDYTWKRVGFAERIWTLESELGTHLVMHGQGLMSRRWRAESATGVWTLARAWSRRVTVTDDRDAVLLRFHSGWLSRGRVEPASGPDLTWRRHWPSRHVLATGEDQPLLTIVRARGFWSRDRKLTVADAARSRADLLPLVALTWLLVLSARHAHAH